VNANVPPAPPADDGTAASNTVSAVDIIDFILSRYILTRSTRGDLLAYELGRPAVKITGPTGKLGHEIRLAFYRERRVTVSDTALRSALETIAAMAASETPQTVHLRAAHDQQRGRIDLDLGLPDSKGVTVTADGWTVTDGLAPGVLFRRTQAVLPLPVPVSDGSHSALFDLLGWKDDDPRALVIRGWLAAAVFGFPRPMPYLFGQQGSAKTARGTFIVGVLDPREALAGSPRDIGDALTSAAGRFLVGYDNLSRVTEQVSDFVCTLVTGGVAEKRTLYTDDDLTLVSFKTTGVMTGIAVPSGFKADALHRLIPMYCDPIDPAARRSLADMQEEFARVHAEVLGAVLDDVVRILANFDRARADVELGRIHLPRMADFARALHALDLALGTTGPRGHFSAYSQLVTSTMTERADADPLVGAVLDLLAQHGGHWAAEARPTLFALSAHVADEVRMSKFWPGERQIKTQLRQSAELLAEKGVRMIERTSNGRSLIVLTQRSDDLAA
jgi:hypothetical protein